MFHIIKAQFPSHVTKILHRCKSHYVMMIYDDATISLVNSIFLMEASCLRAKKKEKKRIMDHDIDSLGGGRLLTNNTGVICCS